MILTVVSPTSVSWWVVEACVCLAAGIGGVLVFVGLWMEGPPDENRFRDIAAFRRHKVRTKRGWNLLMIGIFVEIVVAVGVAARDGWQARQTAIQIAQIDPQKQPISDVSGIAFIEVAEGDSREVDPKPWLPKSVSWVAYMTFRDSNNEPAQLASGLLVADSFTKIVVACRSPNSDRGYAMRFYLDDLGLRENKEMAKKINDISILNINTLFLATNAEVFGGRVTLIVNSQLQKTFTILPQRSLGPTPLGIGITVFATNSTAPTVIFR